MFRRGQRVQVIKSNARKRMHPKEGDVGYLNNMFLFPREKFILMDIFMCQYGGEDKRRTEHKKFVLDLGMTADIRKKISKEGVSKRFFLERNYLCLNPTFYRDIVVSDKDRGKFKCLAQFPQMIDSQGLWPSFARVSSQKNENKDTLFTIPCGSIASDSLITGRKHCVTRLKTPEVVALLNSHNPNFATLIQLYHDYYERSHERGLQHFANNIWSFFTMYIEVETGRDNIHRFRPKKNAIDDLSTTGLQKLAYNLNFMISLNRVALHRAESKYLNQLETENGQNDKSSLIGLIEEGSVAQLINHIELYDMEFDFISNAMMVASIFYRLFFADYNFDSNMERMIPYLRSIFLIEDLKKQIVEIQTAAQSDSAALNRIFELLEKSGGNSSAKEPWAHVTADAKFGGDGYIAFSLNANTGRMRKIVGAGGGGRKRP